MGEQERTLLMRLIGQVKKPLKLNISNTQEYALLKEIKICEYCVSGIYVSLIYTDGESEEATLETLLNHGIEYVE